MKTPLGNNSAKHPKLGMTWKRALKLEKIARLSASGQYSNEQIANHLGCTPQTIVLIRQLPEFHSKMLEVATGVTSSYDQDLRADTDNARAELKSMIPSTMMVIRKALLDSRNPTLQFKAAMEVLDREGSMAKVSKSSVAVEVTPNLVIDQNVAQNLMQLLGSAPQIIDANNTPSHDPNGFTKTSTDALAQQITMESENTHETLAALETLDLSDKKPN